MILWSRPQSSMMGDYTNVTIPVWSIICALVNSHMMTAQANENAKFEASERGISNKQDLPGHTLIFLKVTSTVFTTQILLFKSGPKCSSVNNEVIVSMLYINIWILHKNAQLCTFHSQHATKQHVFTTLTIIILMRDYSWTGMPPWSACCTMNTEMNIWKIQSFNLWNGIWGLLCLVFLTDKVFSWLHKLLLLGTQNVVVVQSARRKKGQRIRTHS